MAGIASGVYSDIEQGCDAAISDELRFIEPNPENTKIYEQFYSEVFCHLYDRNIELMRKLAKFDRD